jgi:hypothetical protein
LFIASRTRPLTVPSGVSVRARSCSASNRPRTRARGPRAARAEDVRRQHVRARRGDGRPTRSSTLASERRSAAASIVTSRSRRLPRNTPPVDPAFRQMARSQVRTDPRSGRYDRACRQTEWNAS